MCSQLVRRLSISDVSYFQDAVQGLRLANLLVQLSLVGGTSPVLLM